MPTREEEDVAVLVGRVEGPGPPRNNSATSGGKLDGWAHAVGFSDDAPSGQQMMQAAPTGQQLSVPSLTSE